MDMSIMYHLEVNVICILMLGFILFKLSGSLEKLTVVGYRGTIRSALVLVCADAVWMLCENGILLPKLPWLNWLANGVYLAMTAVIGYQWLLFCLRRLQIKTSKVARLLMGIPALVLLVLCVVSLGTGWVFYIDDANIYHRGPLHFIQLAVSFAYLGAAGITSLICWLRAKSLAYQADCLTMTNFAILPLLCGVLQSTVTDLPTLQVGLALSSLMVYVNTMESQVNTDSLTGLNNRRQLDNYMHKLLSKNGRKAGSVSLVLLALNDFKLINETCGHITGDQALTKVADILHASCKDMPTALLARYGGAEFVIVLSGEDASKTKQICDNARKNMIANCMMESIPFKLTLSSAVATDNGSDTPATLLAAAEKAMMAGRKKSA